jgi:hypothetical protein
MPPSERSVGLMTRTVGIGAIGMGRMGALHSQSYCRIPSVYNGRQITRFLAAIPLPSGRHARPLSREDSRVVAVVSTHASVRLQTRRTAGP